MTDISDRAAVLGVVDYGYGIVYFTRYWQEPRRIQLGERSGGTQAATGGLVRQSPTRSYRALRRAVCLLWRNGIRVPLFGSFQRRRQPTSKNNNPWGTPRVATSQRIPVWVQGAVSQLQLCNNRWEGVSA